MKRGIVYFVFGIHEPPDVYALQDRVRSRMEAGVRRLYLEGVHNVDRRVELERNLKLLQCGAVDISGFKALYEKIGILELAYRRSDIEIRFEPSINADEIFGDLSSLIIRGHDQFRSGDYISSIKTRRAYVKKMAKINRLRHDSIKRDLQLFYQRKPDEDVVAVFGSNHRLLATELEGKLPIEVEIVSGETKSITDELIEKEMNGFLYESDENRRLLAASILEIEIRQQLLLEGEAQTKYESVEKARSIAEGLSDSDILEVSKFIRKYEGFSDAEAGALVLYWLEKRRGIKF